MRTYSAIVLGAGGVGKSSLTLRLVEGAFFDGYDPTIEDVYTKTLKVDGELCALQITDTAGAEQFTAVNEYYLKSARGFILVFRYACSRVCSLHRPIFLSVTLLVPPFLFLHPTSRIAL
ncbi:hypothetical protein RSAG8_01088, partial [Rhizoctonia solani AG-8 WAC10335]